MALQATFMLADESWHHWLEAQLDQVVAVSRIAADNPAEAVTMLESRAAPDIVFVVIDRGETGVTSIESVRSALPA